MLCQSPRNELLLSVIKTFQVYSCTSNTVNSSISRVSDLIDTLRPRLHDNKYEAYRNFIQVN